MEFYTVTIEVLILYIGISYAGVEVKYPLSFQSFFKLAFLLVWLGPELIEYRVLQVLLKSQKWEGIQLIYILSF